MSVARKSARTRVLLTGVAAAAVLAAATSYASPWWRVHQLHAAVAERDAARVSEFVDFPALRASVKAELMAGMDAGSLAQEARENPFAAFGKAMARAVIDPVVDALVTPAGVLAMLEAGEVRIRPDRRPDRHPETPAPAPDGATGEKARYALSYRSWDRVAIAREDKDGGAFILHRHGLWSWKLGGIELPRER